MITTKLSYHSQANASHVYPIDKRRLGLAATGYFQYMSLSMPWSTEDLQSRIWWRHMQFLHHCHFPHMTGENGYLDLWSFFIFLLWVLLLIYAFIQCVDVVWRFFAFQKKVFDRTSSPSPAYQYVAKLFLRARYRLRHKRLCWYLFSLCVCCSSSA